jgi:hypothetical protein
MEYSFFGLLEASYRAEKLVQACDSQRCLEELNG